MQKMERLSPVKFDEFANRACRQNNENIIARNEMQPTLGGNGLAYTEITKVNIACEEFTLPRFEPSTGGEFVALQMILDWGRNGPLGKQTPILKKDLSSVGISVKAHRMTVNLVQVLYVKGIAPGVPGVMMAPQSVVIEQRNPVFVETVSAP